MNRPGTPSVDPVLRNRLCRVERPPAYPTRFPVSDEHLDWSVDFPDYSPMEYDAPRAGSPKAKAGDYEDPAAPTLVDWSQRYAFSGSLMFDALGYPLNPAGRTDIHGRGVLNAWGPTLAADPIITREGQGNGLELLVITRSDNGNRALPGGKLEVNRRNEPIESVQEAASREAAEEAGIDLDFKDGRVVYSGYVDDERNTDNAWMESTAIHQHLGSSVLGIVLAPRAEDADFPEWVPIDEPLINSLNASNGFMVRKALEL